LPSTRSLRLPDERPNQPVEVNRLRLGLTRRYGGVFASLRSTRTWSRPGAQRFERPARRRQLHCDAAPV